jgi:hypothetical protein
VVTEATVERDLGVLDLGIGAVDRLAAAPSLELPWGGPARSRPSKSSSLASRRSSHLPLGLLPRTGSRSEGLEADHAQTCNRKVA